MPVYCSYRKLPARKLDGSKALRDPAGPGIGAAVEGRMIHMESENQDRAMTGSRGRWPTGLRDFRPGGWQSFATSAEKTCAGRPRYPSIRYRLAQESDMIAQRLLIFVASAM